MDKALNELTNFEELKKFLSSLLVFKEDEIKKDVNFIKQCLGFVIENSIQSPEQLLSELENIFFKIENIEWLTI